MYDLTSCNVMMKDNILVIGNGFDLLHKRKTKYSHFLDFLKLILLSPDTCDNEVICGVKDIFPLYESSNLIRYFLKQYDYNKSAGNWIDMENDLKVFIKTLINFINNENKESNNRTKPNYTYRLIRLPFCYKVLLSSLEGFAINNNGIDFLLRNEYIDSWGYINKEKMLSTLEEELNKIICLLEYYLNFVEPKERDCELEKVKLIDNIDPTYIISFNYTDTFEKVYGINERKITYIHGKLGENNLVLGYDDDDSLEYDDLAFKKYYQRLIKGTESELSLGRFVEGIAVNMPIHFVGHSLDSSDKEILCKLINGENQVHIYCRNKKEKDERIANVIKLVGKEKTISGMLYKKIIFEEM